MRASASRFLALAAALACVPTALAQKSLDFRSAGEVAVLYDAPSQRGKKLFVAPRGMPFEVVVSVEGWLKVRDRAGDMAWIERKLVSESRSVVATVLAAVRERPDESAPTLFSVAPDVTLELIEAPGAGAAWARVRHRDGTSGFVRSNQVWGL
ncbi:MAG: SH3 domain-containing protein [Burkholderiales bacterium]